MTTSGDSPFEDQVRPLRILFYIDSGAMVAHCVTAAELIRKQLKAEIIVMMVDSEKYLDETVKNYQVYDYGGLFNAGREFSPVWPREKTEGGFGRLLRSLLRSRSIQSAIRKSGVQSKIVQAVLLPWLFLLMMAFRVLRLARNIRRRLHLGIRVKEALRDTSRGTRVLSVLVSLFFSLRAGLRFVRRVQRGARTWLRQVLLDPLRKVRAGQLFEHLSRLLLTSTGVDRFLRAVEPDLIILPEDNVETLSTILVAKGRRLNIPSMVIPFTIPNPLEPARYYFDNPLYQARGPFARRLVDKHPKWRFHHEGRDLLRQPAIKALCQEFLGLSSPAPWILNRGHTVSIALDSDAQRDLYVKLGFPVEQLKVIGDMNGAMFHHVRNNKLRFVEEICSKYGWQSDRPLILCGFPPDQYQGTDTSRFEFPDYEALVEAWMESFRMLGPRANILIRPHPRIPLERLSGFEGPNVKISLHPTAELIPLCDLYVASISATIRWAIACGIPVINYDTFRYRYADYESAAGVVGVEDVGEFRSLMTRFVNDEKFAADLTERQRSVMNYWGQLDDGTGRRLSALVLEAVAGAGRINPNKERQWDLRPVE
jgi:glycosyltransferase involved in cell wall biosynthesis